MTKTVLPKQEVLTKMTKLLHVASDMTRLKILYTLLDGPKYVGDIQELVGASQSLVSHQLRTLKDAKLVRSERDGTKVRYFLSDAHIVALLSLVQDHALED